MQQKRMSVGEIVNAAGSLYTKNIGYVVFLCVVAFVPIYVINMLIPADFYERLEEFYIKFYELYTIMLGETEGTDSLSTLMSYFRGDSFAYVVRMIILLLGVELVFTPLLSGGVTYIAGRGLNNREVKFEGVVSASLAKIGKYLVNTLLCLMVSLLLPTYFFAIGIYFLIGYAFCTQIIAATGRWGLSALSLSGSLVRGRRFRTLGWVVSYFIIYYIVASMLSSAWSGVSNIVLNLIIYVAIKIVMSLFSMIYAVWFWDNARSRGLQYLLDDFR